MLTDMMYNMQDKFRKKSGRLKQTGGGVNQEDIILWIPNNGPDHNTTPAARNIWEQLNAEWSFFDCCHQLWATKNSTIPPVTITGVGPRGHTEIYHRPIGSQPTSSSAFVPTLGPLHDPAGAITAQEREDGAPVSISRSTSPLIDPNLAPISLNVPVVALPTLPLVATTQKENEPASDATPRSQAPRSVSGNSLTDLLKKAMQSAKKRASSKPATMEDQLLTLSR